VKILGLIRSTSAASGGPLLLYLTCCNRSQGQMSAQNIRVVGEKCFRGATASSGRPAKVIRNAYAVQVLRRHQGLWSSACSATAARSSDLPTRLNVSARAA